MSEPDRADRHLVGCASSLSYVGHLHRPAASMRQIVARSRSHVMARSTSAPVQRPHLQVALSSCANVLQQRSQRAHLWSRQLLPSPSAVVPLAIVSPGGRRTAVRGRSPFPLPFTLSAGTGWAGARRRHARRVSSISCDREAPSYTLSVVTSSCPRTSYEDPCLSDAEPMSPPVGPTVDDLTAALTNLPGHPCDQPSHRHHHRRYSGKTFDIKSTLLISECLDGAQWAPMWTYDGARSRVVLGPRPQLPPAHRHPRRSTALVCSSRIAWTFDDTAPSVVADTFRSSSSIDFT